MKTAGEILENNTGHAYGLMGAMVIKSMKEYAQLACEDLRERIAEEAKTKSGVTFGHRNGRLDKEIKIVVDKDSIRTIEINLP